jgi:hypothetical protein
MKYNRLGIFSFILHSLSPLLQTIPMRKVFITYSSKRRKRGERLENAKRILLIYNIRMAMTPKNGN